MSYIDYSNINTISNNIVKEMDIEKYKMPNESNRIKELEDRIRELESENIKLSELKSRIQNDLCEKQKKIMNYECIHNRLTLCKNRLMFATSFLQACGQQSCLYGSTVRKLFECLFHPTKLESNNSIGDLINSDINIIFHYQQNFDKVDITTKFYDFLHCLETTRIMCEKQNSNISNEYNPIFNGYKLTGMSLDNRNKEGEQIPKAKLFFVNGTENLTLNITCWRYKEIVDFSVNNFFISCNGIQPFFEYNFFQFLENIHFQETKFIHRPDVLQSYAFPNETCLTRQEKCFYLNKVSELITKRSIKVLSSDYKITKNNPFHSIENKEDCIITGVSAPYPVVTLQCGHKISIMAYKGIVSKTCDGDTQSLRCPLCRQDLKLLFHVKPENGVKYKLINMEDLHKQKDITESITNNKIISREAMEIL